ncbi:von Willebrand factor A domain-containing protein 5A-like [Leptodactylus fuscus]|uniref:von Willebrand factor A domain-containing protein 5A-like n=1 Tax=Leptodactylus fuscus TaxID=238119 RepID=UPI003F4F0446
MLKHSYLSYSYDKGSCNQDRYDKGSCDQGISGRDWLLEGRIERGQTRTRMASRLDIRNRADFLYDSGPSEDVTTPQVVNLISLQNADGSWNLNPEFSAILGLSQQDISNKNPDKNVDPSVWATVLAVIWLHAFYLNQIQEWILLEGKAFYWLKAKAGSSLEQFVRAGNELLKTSVVPKVFGL